MPPEAYWNEECLNSSLKCHLNTMFRKTAVSLHPAANTNHTYEKKAAENQ